MAAGVSVWHCMWLPHVICAARLPRVAEIPRRLVSDVSKAHPQGQSHGCVFQMYLRCLGRFAIAVKFDRPGVCHDLRKHTSSSRTRHLYICGGVHFACHPYWGLKSTTEPSYWNSHQTYTKKNTHILTHIPNNIIHRRYIQAIQDKYKIPSGNRTGPSPGPL